MKKIISLLFAAALMLPVGAQAAEYGVYVAPKVGVSIQNFKVKTTVDGDAESVKGNKAVFGGGIAIGYDFMTQFDMPLRAEAELTAWGSASKSKHWSEDGDSANLKGQVEVMPVFLNVYYDFHNETAFTPYVGAGIGFANVKTKNSFSANSPADGFNDGFTKTSTKTSFAWNLGLGCAYAFNEVFSVDLGYRYANYGSSKSHSGVFEEQAYHFRSENNSQHQLMLGARFTF